MSKKLGLSFGIARFNDAFQYFAILKVFTSNLVLTPLIKLLRSSSRYSVCVSEGDFNSINPIASAVSNLNESTKSSVISKLFNCKRSVVIHFLRKLKTENSKISGCSSTPRLNINSIIAVPMASLPLPWSRNS